MSTDSHAADMLLAACAAKTRHAHRRMAYARLNADLTIQQVSANFAAMAPAAPQPQADVLHQPLSDVLWEFVGADEALHDVWARRAPFFRLEHVNREQRDGSLHYLTFSVYRLEPDSGLDGLLLLVEDDTDYGRLHHQLVQDRNELRLVQGQLAAANKELTRIDRMKSLFLSMAAHDLRTPLSAIQGYAEMLLLGIAEPGSPKAFQYLDIIQQQSARLNQLIDDIVDLDLIEQGKLTLNLTPCDINPLLQEASSAYKFQLERRSITVHYNLAPEPITIWGDAEKMLRVFYNLVGNAVKYMASQGQITLRSQQQDGQAIIEVEDTGPGMTAEQLDNLFILYYRSEDVAKSPVKGSGLGLFIVKTMVEAHQGQVQVTSQPGQGSKFTLRLPLHQSDSGEILLQ
ncbi:MAG: HAMP domain-containing histidine kinase [Anaerolineaceae bacterium]|nr:HAMP domain-containing histidine kinase [Anaerolineaceae bacterium]